ncbi:S8 family serine peptidase [Flavobacterium ardleyense]|uniref:S8 family serine peptidase n=1 Tax=Flavobacterium ardleyense TaxID=2038737 RepID=A0ABW5Z9J7_9FLAO
MKNKILKITALVLLSFTVACNDDFEEGNNQVNGTDFNKELLSPQQINEIIDASVENTGQFHWENASLQVLWSASQHGSNIVTIGYGTSKEDYIKANSTNSDKIVATILNTITENEKGSIEKTLIYKDEVLNIIDVIVTDQKTLYLLRNNKNVRYVEPADYRYSNYAQTNQRSGGGGSGCGFEATTLVSSDYTTITPGAKVPWNFYNHNIPTAWAKSTGAGVTIGVIDTGVSPSQSLLGSNFNNGASSGRTVQKFGTYVDSALLWATTTDGFNDQCGHGTSMTATATAPRNNKGLPVGVAYNANLISYRASANVVLEGYHEHKGVQNAFTGLGNNSNVKIISMSMGHFISIGRIVDGVRYAHGKGKLIFCAGGTSTSFTSFVGVIFPAWMPETVAVTGIKEGAGYTKCSICHSGAQMDFTVVMERKATGNTAPVLSYYENMTDYVGGSSVATATTAGIAALVWSKNPSWTRAQVLTKLQKSSSNYPTRDSKFGYGNINAALAVQ